MKRLAVPWLFPVLLVAAVMPCKCWSFDPVQTTNDLAPNEPPIEGSGGLRPLYEAGLGVGLVYGSDYPGSDHSQLWLLPIPYFVYRGDTLRSDKEGGTRARWQLGPAWEFNISGSGGLPSSSSSDARAGMPNLEWLGEVGPAVSVRLIKTEHHLQLRLNIPLRASGSTNLHHIAWRGLVLAPNLVLDMPTGIQNLSTFAQLTTTYADRTRMDYYYGVATQYETAMRYGYRARAGYLDSTAAVGTAYDVPRYDVSLYTIIAYDSLAGAANIGSPLLRKREAWNVGTALIWRFAQSSQHVAAQY